MSIEQAERTIGKSAAGGGPVTVADIADATELGKNILLTVDAAALLELITALGSSGDQVLDGKLQLNHQLVLKSVQQTDANVIAFYFGEDDGVIDVAIKATGTVNNRGQIAISVRDDSELNECHHYRWERQACVVPAAVQGFHGNQCG